MDLRTCSVLQLQRLLFWNKAYKCAKCWATTEDEWLVPGRGGPGGGRECEIFTAILRGLPALKPELSAVCLPSQGSLSWPLNMVGFCWTERWEEEMPGKERQWWRPRGGWWGWPLRGVEPHQTTASRCTDQGPHLRLIFFSVFLPKPPNPVVPNLSLQHQKPGGGLVGKRGLVCIAGYWGLSSLQEQMYLNIRKELHLQSPCCLHSEEKLIHDKVESGVWGAPLSSDC